MINLVIALKPEAKPLIEYFDLKMLSKDKLEKPLFPIYQNEMVSLIISGIGKTNAAAATAYLHQITGGISNQGWLNLRIAGHQTLTIGEGVLVNKITDTDIQKNWYPSQVIQFNQFDIKSSSLITINQPETEYAENSLYDMEGSGFYSIASKCSTTEFIQSYKIVSDNQSNPATFIDTKQVETLINNRITEIAGLVTALSESVTMLNQIHKPPIAFDDFKKHWRFTVSQEHQLEHLLKRWETISPTNNIQITNFKHLKKSKEVLLNLKEKLSLLPINLQKTRT